MYRFQVCPINDLVVAEVADSNVAYEIKIVAEDGDSDSDGDRHGRTAHVVAVDIINFMDALKIDKAIIAGFDWARAPLTSWRCFGRNAARESFRSAAI